MREALAMAEGRLAQVARELTQESTASPWIKETAMMLAQELDALALQETPIPSGLIGQWRDVMKEVEAGSTTDDMERGDAIDRFLEAAAAGGMEGQAPPPTPN